MTNAGERVPSSRDEGVWLARVIPVPDRSKYRFAPYWEADTPLDDWPETDGA